MENNIKQVNSQLDQINLLDQQLENVNLAENTGKEIQKSRKQAKQQKNNLKHLYSINPKGWLKSEDKTMQIMFQFGLPFEEYFNVHCHVLGKASDPKKIKILEVLETQRKDTEGSELVQAEYEFQHLQLTFKLEEELNQDNFQKNSKAPQQQQVINISNQDEKKDDKDQNCLQNNEIQQNENDQIEKCINQNQNQKKTRIIWCKVEYLRQSRVQYFYSLLFRRIPQDYSQITKMRWHAPKNHDKTLYDILQISQNFQNLKEHDPSQR
ncbi:hypothetical protein PPERSA_10253 [Pseudocohnilembus persalinus]|uniref:Uncharacterized protein n=1 Tax=Pseudocohnilembus persalinus TaxID=266149 RepID=A0A0V0R011_PSEPJ|nr:hypothetical protein PPERSA_10253 [Pseudocohnilembus persalinus]|eukprot:KRX07865.1 hypothetical protein PPERSA_10253 [Pseudocohnilembus persalinus]